MRVESERKDKKGCKIGGKWYNYSDAVIKYLAGRSIWNKEVEVEFSPDGKFINRINEKKADGQGTTHDPPQKVDWEAKDRRIVRQNALSQANSFLSTLAGIGELEKKGGKEIQDIMFLIAGRCEKWVYGEYNPLAGADSPIKEAEVEKNA